MGRESCLVCFFFQLKKLYANLAKRNSSQRDESRMRVYNEKREFLPSRPPGPIHMNNLRSGFLVEKFFPRAPAMPDQPPAKPVAAGVLSSCRPRLCASLNVPPMFSQSPTFLALTWAQETGTEGVMEGRGGLVFMGTPAHPGVPLSAPREECVGWPEPGEQPGTDPAAPGLPDGEAGDGPCAAALQCSVQCHGLHWLPHPHGHEVLP